MSVEREMSLAEWCAKLPSLHLVNRELAELTKQLAALAEQNEKMRETLESVIISSHLDTAGTIAVWRVKEALSLPDLASPVLNRIKAEAYREAAEICETTFAHGVLQLGHRAAIAQAIRAKADELSKGEPA